MSPEQAQRFADTLLALADELWEKHEEVMRAPVIHPYHIQQLVGPAVGSLQGTARAIEWHAKHDGGSE